MGKLAYPCIPCPESVISPVVRVMGCITWGLAESQVDNSMSEQAAFPACRSHSVELGEGMRGSLEEDARGWLLRGTDCGNLPRFCAPEGVNQRFARGAKS